MTAEQRGLEGYSHLLFLQTLQIFFSINSGHGIFLDFHPSLFVHPGRLDLSFQFQVWACFCHLDLPPSCGSSQVSIKVCVESDCYTSPFLCQVCQQQPLSPPGSHCCVTPGRGQCATQKEKKNLKQKKKKTSTKSDALGRDTRQIGSRHGVI